VTAGEQRAAGPVARQPIEDDDALLRRIPDQNPQMWITRNGVTRPTSAAMNPSSDDGGLSVDVRRLLADPTQPLSVIAGLPSHGLVEFHAKLPRDLGLDVEHQPLPQRPSHANVVRFPEDDKARHRVRQRLAKSSRLAWVQMPAGALQPPAA